MTRRADDFYETGPFQTRALLANQQVNGFVAEVCCGDGSIVKVIRERGGAVYIITNDLSRSREADFHQDASGSTLYGALKDTYHHYPDWVITNPPYTMPQCRDIVESAIRYTRVGVAMLLRITFLEPTDTIHPRGPFLETYPPSRLLVLPRYSYTGNGKTDSTTTAWHIWLKQPSTEPPILCLYDAERKYWRAGDPPLQTRRLK